jgi:hypothetical protein
MIVIVIVFVQHAQAARHMPSRPGQACPMGQQLLLSSSTQLVPGFV